jgi:hypothetical protein
MRKSIIPDLTLCAAMGAGHAYGFPKKRLTLHTGIRSRSQKRPDLLSFQLNVEYRHTLLLMTACTSPSRSAPRVLMA